MMYKYEFHKIDINLLTSKFSDDYKKIIEKYAAEGWRLVQIFAPSIGPVGSSNFCELIFEKEFN